MCTFALLKNCCKSAVKSHAKWRVLSPKNVFYRRKMYCAKTAQSVDAQRKTRNLNDYGDCYMLERMTGIEPALSAWEADALPLDDIRTECFEKA